MTAGEPRHFAPRPFVQPPARSHLRAMLDASGLAGADASNMGAALAAHYRAVLEARGFALDGSDPTAAEMLAHMQVGLAVRFPPLARRRRPRRGNPGPDPLLAFVGLQQWNRERRARPGASLAAQYDATARALGPGLTRHHVRRAVQWAGGLARDVAEPGEGLEHVALRLAVAKLMAAAGRSVSGYWGGPERSCAPKPVRDLL